MIRSSDNGAARCVDGLSNAVVLAWGRRRAVIAFAAGGLSALAQPPYHAFFVLFLTFPVLVWLIDGLAPARSGIRHWFLAAFWTGWLFGFGYFLAGLWWIGKAFLVDAETFAWLLPFAVLLLPAGLAIFWGLAVVLAKLLWSNGWQRIFALGAGFGVAEWLRATILTGFPWNSIGYTLTGGEVMMQSSWLVGLSALNILAVLIFSSPAALARQSQSKARSFWLPMSAILVFCGFAAFGFARLSSTMPTQFAPDVIVRIVQPAIQQDEKWAPGNERKIFQDLLDLTREAPFPENTNVLVVWPESTLPFLLTNETWALPAIADALPEKASLLVGAVKAESLPGEETRYFNSAYLISDKGEILSSYDKTHLTPFGEYLPFQDRLEAVGLEQLTQIQGGFTPGFKRTTMSVPGIPQFSPLICYEVIFPGQLEEQNPPSDFIVNLTNDAWFGKSPGPYQHFHQARVRAVEAGVPLVRAANSGLSGVTDSYGRIVQITKLFERTMLDVALPISRKNTQSERRHRLLSFFLLLISIALAKTTVSFRTT